MMECNVTIEQSINRKVLSYKLIFLSYIIVIVENRKLYPSPKLFLNSLRCRRQDEISSNIYKYDLAGDNEV